MKDSFVFRKAWKDAVSGMSAEVRLEFYEAVIEYATTGNVPELKQLARLAFNFAKADLDKDAEKEEDIRIKRVKAGKAHKGNQYTKNGTSVPKMEQMEQVFQVFHSMEQMEQMEHNGTGEREKKNEKELPPITPFIEKEKKEKREEPLNRDEIFCEKFFSNQASIEQLLMKFGMKPTDKKELENMANDILNEWKITEQEHLNYNDFARHLMNTLRIRLSAEGSIDKRKKDDAVKAAIDLREQEHEERERRYEEMRKNAVSREEAMKSPEYQRAMREFATI